MRHSLSFSRALPDFVGGRRTPRDLLEQCIDVIAARDATVKAFVTLNIADARRSADAATARYRSGTPLSPVDGCPVAIKDIIATADMPTQMNSAVFEGWQPSRDAACVAALRRGGAVILGKTVTTEFAMGRSGPTTNPFDPARTPGGSSSGSAAAVGAGMVPAALATQTQGSILRPASYCGAIGFKPTTGTLDTSGIHPLSSTCDHLGVIAASLEDAWRVARFLEGAGPSTALGPGPELPAPIKPRKLIRLYTRGWAELDDRTRAAFDSLVASLETRGVAIASRDSDPGIARLEQDLDAGLPGSIAIVAYEMKRPYEQYIERFGELIGPRIHELIDSARAMTPADYESLLANRRRMQGVVQRHLEGCDGFVTLAASGPAPPGLEHTGSRTFQSYGSWLGLPAFSLPLMEVEGLPVGLQLLGPMGADDGLCAVANWLMPGLG